jgi:hypothetical protein
MTSTAANVIERAAPNIPFRGDRLERLAALENRVAHADREERNMILAKDAVKRKADDLRRREESLEIREEEYRMRLSILERRVQDLLVREAAVAIAARNVGRAQ